MPAAAPTRQAAGQVKMMGARRNRDQWQDRLAAGLNGTRTALADSLQCEADQIGLKIWILPPWYYRILVVDWFNVRAWAEYFSCALSRPRMIKVAESNPFGKSETRWTIGKGIIGQGALNPGEKEYIWFIHREAWSGFKDAMSRRDFYREPANVRLGRSRNNMRNLKRHYGTVIVVPMRPTSDGRPFGCITMDSKHDIELAAESIKASGQYLARVAPEIAVLVRHETRYKFPRDVRHLIADLSARGSN